MVSQEVKKLKLPDQPGVYFFKRGKEVLYVGKATSLKDRVRSYFNTDIAASRGPRIESMLDQATILKWQVTDSVLEALLLETAEIKKLQPKYNAKEKDDKSYWQIIITDEEFPQVLQVRAKNLTAISYKLKAIYGPFVSGSELKEALKIIRKIFPYRDNRCKPLDFARGKPCFNRQIGLCPGVCTGEISKTDYAKTVRNLKLFFSGKKGAVVKNLEQEMKRLAKLNKFEDAAKIRNQIFALNHIRDVALIKAKHDQPHFAKATRGNPFRVEAYDVAHTSGKEVVGVMTVVEDGEIKKSDYRKFKLSREKNDDVGNLVEIVSRRLGHPEWRAPNLVVIDGGKGQLNAVEKLLDQAGFSWPVMAVTKDEHHKAKQILGAKDKIAEHEREILLGNSEAHRFAISWHRQRRDKIV
jgi:excinuclease ABC subunit C